MRTTHSLLSLALSLGLLAACSADGGGGAPQDPIATGGAVDPGPAPLADVDGSVTIVGTSDSVPSLNESFTGPAESEAAGGELVRCTYHPYGEDGGPPELTILTGYEGRIYGQAQVSIFDVIDYGPLSRRIEYNEQNVLDGLGLDLLVTARFTQDSATDYIEYWTFYEDDGVTTVRSVCQVELREFTSEWVSGTVACMDLFASVGSLEYTGIPPEPRANVTVSFDCPLIVDDGTTVPGTGGTGGTGGSGGTGGAGGSTGGSGGTGGAGDAPKCTGYATPCSLLSQTECSLAVGCLWEGECSGSADSCYAQYSSYSCNRIDGCYWSTYDDDCSGVASSCYSQYTSLGCSQQGCTWSQGCEGVPSSCETWHIEAFCLEQPGCTWE